MGQTDGRTDGRSLGGGRLINQHAYHVEKTAMKRTTTTVTQHVNYFI